MDANQRLEDDAAELDPSLSAEEKARRLRASLEAQVEDTETKERSQEFDDATSAPAQAGEGVAEHERDMQRRGFEKAGPPE